MNTSVDAYFTDGCGRCPLGGTPQCKVNKWPKELAMLRRLLLDSGLNEECKWGVPCYCFRNGNVALLSAFKDYCALSFFKGALLSDTAGILSKPGDNSQAARLIRFTGLKEIVEMKDTLRTYLHEAIEVEKEGLKVDFKQGPVEILPAELQSKLDKFPDLKAAFDALTPGRQRGYVLFFTQPKQSKTRESRIEKCIPRILGGKGLND